MTIMVKPPWYDYRGLSYHDIR